ncbi:hypothetical protein E2C01_036473 [Portunus trituberculatus]|uniref:Uncharacterized protein n=1 Tax=Portunus trituberculatus TaxID=210409 RepID=A0A5B7F6T6_PORTR|nr:hypothetical protein [Portunus trituberculatus]
MHDIMLLDSATILGLCCAPSVDTHAEPPKHLQPLAQLSYHPCNGLNRYTNTKAARKKIVIPQPVLALPSVSNT